MLRRRRPVLCVVLLSMLLLLTAPPARACACGGFAAADGEKVAASAEYAALAFDGTAERVLLSMNTFTGARDAALLIPTPRRAAGRAAVAAATHPTVTDVRLNHLRRPDTPQIAAQGARSSQMNVTGARRRDA